MSPFQKPNNNQIDTRSSKWFQAIFSQHVILWFSLVGLLLFFKTVFYDFSYFDDNVLIIDHLAFLRNISTIFRAFQLDVFSLINQSAAYYRPLLTISFMVDALIAGANPWMYHLTNILLHIGTALCVYYALRKVGYSQNQSFIAGLIFLVHPIVTQAVAWIPGRNDSLLTIFILISFIFYLDYFKAPSKKNYFWQLIFTALAIFTKETALLVPFVFSLYSIMVQKESLQNSKLWQVVGGWVTVIFIWFLMRTIALTSAVQYSLPTIATSLFQNLPATIQFIGKTILPFNLSVLPIIQDTRFIYGVLALLLIGGLILQSKSIRTRHLIFGSAWFLLFLVPSFIRPNPNIVADFLEHRAYLPLFGALIVIIEINPLTFIPQTHIRQLILCGTILGLILITFIHLDKYRNRLTYWQSAAETSPHSPLAHRNYGVMLYFEGQNDQALLEYQKALELNPKEEMAHNNIGVIYLNENKLTDAKNEFQLELKNNPNYDNSTYNLGLVEYKEKNFDDAESLWQQAIDINPLYTDAYSSLAVLYINQNDTDKLSKLLNLMIARNIPIPAEIQKTVTLE